MRITAAAGLCLILAACTQGGSAGTPVPVATASSSPDTNAASGPRISPPPVTPPTPPGTNLPAFACADTGGGTSDVSAGVTTVRMAEQADYDRFVIQFDGAVPKYTVKRQSKPTFIMSPSGQSITLGGTAGAVVRVFPATETATYSGPTDISHAEFLVLKEARLIEEFEGVLSWALGLDHAACLRTFTLTGPARLVVDFTTATS